MSRAGLGPRARLVAAGAVTTLVLLPLIWLWQASLVPGTYSIMDIGASSHAHSGGARTSVATLVADPAQPADVAVTLTARQERFQLASGRLVDGYTLNGRSPGPTIRAREGDLVQVTLVNASVSGGITLHWHGVDVPNAMDGVAGVTQDAVGLGDRFVYRFVAEQVGTFWYHSHQISHKQVSGGLLGALVVEPRVGRTPEALDVVALAHVYHGVRTLNGLEGDVSVRARPGRLVRVRVVNTDNGPTPVWVAGAPYRVVAVDGVDVNRGGEVHGRAVLLTAGARVDVAVRMPGDGGPVRVHVGGPRGVLLGSRPQGLPPAPVPRETLDLLSYGEPAPLGFDPDQPDRRFDYAIGRRPGFLDGRPGMFWTVNGRMFPNVPVFHVREGDVVRMRIANSSGEVHPMHLHGHHAVVLSRNGVAATGSPWWTDSLNVANGETYEITFVAANPGIWMDHCHNLPHAAQGLVAHLAYEGVTSPYLVGGAHGNQPE